MEAISEPGADPVPTVSVGGVKVSGSQLAEAIGILEKDHSTSVKQPLRHRANPLWHSDYHSIAAEYRKDHPGEELGAGSPQHKMPRVKSAFLSRLKQLQDDLHPGIELQADPALAAAIVQVQHELDTEPLPADDYDARQRVYAQILRRRGQQQFRSLLMQAYSSRCAVTGCAAADVLEAAHLRPSRGPASNKISNGLLLRADIHTLLDLNLIAVDPQQRRVAVAARLNGTEYESLIGAELSEPALAWQRPSEDALSYLWLKFQGRES